MQAFILTNGKKTGFGKPKALMDFNGEPLIVHQISLLQTLTSKIAILAREAEVFYPFNLPVYSDIFLDKGDIGSIYTGLKYTKDKMNLFIPCDFPFLTYSFLKFMIDKAKIADNVIPHAFDGYHPACAVYSKNSFSVLESQIISGNNKISHIFTKIRFREISPLEIALFNPRGNLFKIFLHREHHPE